MINRISEHIQRAPPKGPPDTYALVETHTQLIPVYGWVGELVSTQLRKFWTPRWITFRDIAGASYTVRSREIRSVMSTSPEVRATVRAFYRARDREHEEDQPW